MSNNVCKPSMNIRQKFILILTAIVTMIFTQSMVNLHNTSQIYKWSQRVSLAREIQLTYTNIGADRKLLRLWYAEQLISGQATLVERETLIENVRSNIKKAQILTAQQQADAAAERDFIAADAESLTLVTADLRDFRFHDDTADVKNLTESEKLVLWNQFKRLVDFQENRDVVLIINNAITVQDIISDEATVFLKVAANRIAFTRFVFLGLLTLGVIALGWYFLRALNRPLNDLMRGISKLQSVDSDSRWQVPVRGSDEFARLASSFNKMSQEIYAAHAKDIARNDQLELAVQLRTAELDRANEALLRIDARRRQFFADISHELRTPASVILGEAEVTLRAKQPSIDCQRSSLQTIVKTSQQLIHRLNELLILAKQGLPMEAPQLVTVSLAPTIASVLAQARALAVIAGVVVHDVEWQSPLEFGLIKKGFNTGELSIAPALTVATDPIKLHQMLMVFYDNALRYTPVGGEVFTRAFVGLNGLTVQIQDTGIGLAGHEQDELFSRHFRGEKARNMRADGAGLGLSIAKTIAESLNIELLIGSTADDYSDNVMPGFTVKIVFH